MVDLGTYVSVDADDVEQGWRTLTTEDKTAVEVLIGRAVAILPSQSPGLLDRLAAGTIPPESVEQVLIQAVRRAIFPALANPEGVKKFSRSGDDYSEAFEWDTDTLAAGLYFTAAELAMLAPPKLRRGRAFTIDTTPRY